MTARENLQTGHNFRHSGLRLVYRSFRRGRWPWIAAWIRARAPISWKCRVPDIAVEIRFTPDIFDEFYFPWVIELLFRSLFSLLQLRIDSWLLPFQRFRRKLCALLVEQMPYLVSFGVMGPLGSLFGTVRTTVPCGWFATLGEVSNTVRTIRPRRRYPNI